MKMIIIIMTTFLLHASASTFGQKVSLNEKNVPLERIFKQIRFQTGYDFIYNAEIIRIAKPIDINIKNLDLPEALIHCFSGQDLSFEIKEKSILVKIKEASIVDKIKGYFVAIDIKGKVIDENGEAMEGATVTLKGSGRVVNTNKNGEFSFANIDENAVLVISFLGYETKEITAGKFKGTVKMELTSGKLKEVTVTTAYGVEKRTRELGYAVAKVTGKELNQANSGNLLTGLTGKVSGLNISTQSADMNPQMRVLLRGIRSFNESSNNQPLFIFNGSPLSFGSDQSAASLVMDFINNINPADIEDVTVLKGANGTAMYGPEGVNGVIIITTKRGGKGKPVINFRNNTTFSRIDYRNDNNSQRQYGMGTGLVDVNGNGVYSADLQNGWGPAYDGSLVPIGRPDENGDYQMVTYSDKKDARRFFGVAAKTQNNLSISQSDAVSDFYLGLNHVIQKGFVPRDKQNAVSLLFNGGRKFGKLNVQLNSNFSRVSRDLGPEFLYLKSTPTFIPLLSYKDYKNDKWSDNNHYWSDAEMMSPYQAADISRTLNTEYAFTGGLVLEFKPLSWLTISEKPSFLYNGIYEKSTKQPIYFSDFAKLNGGYNRYRDILATLKDETRTGVSLNNDFLISTVNKSGDFVFRNIVGSSVRENYTKKLVGSGNPIVPVFNLAFSRDIPYGSEEAFLTRTYSFFGTSAIGYKDRVFLEFIARNDWDSKRAKVGRGKNLYVGANVSMILNEIVPAIGKISWLDYAQLKFAVNGTANMNIEPYQSERTLQLSQNFPYSSSDFEDGVLSYDFMNGNPNPYLEPEKIFSQEYGLSLKMLKNKIGFDFSYYTQKNNGVIMKVSAPWLSGGSTIDNLGVFRNFGWEADLKFNPIFRLDNGLSLKADVRMAMNDNKVLSISDAYDGVFPLKTPYYGSMYGIVARTGSHVFEYQVFDWTRDPQGRIVVDEAKRMPIPVSNTTPLYKGRSMPKWTGGMNFNLEWHNFSFAVLGEFNKGAMHYFEEGSADVMNGLHPLTTYNDRKPFVIPNSSYKDASGNYVANTGNVSSANKELYSRYGDVSNLYLVKADFLKIKEIVLGYEIPVKSKMVKRLGCSIYGRNVFNFYAKGDNIYGDPQLIKGPGYRGYRTIPNNLSGSSSEASAVAGIVEYGFIATVNF